MPGDLTLVWNAANGYADWQVGQDDLVSGSTLETAVIRSLFTDKRAPPDSLLPYPSADLRGCWSDTYSASGPSGSLLWLLERAVISDRSALLLQAQTYAADALAWLISEGVAATITPTATWRTASMIALQIVLTEPSGNVNRYTYSWLWAGG